MADRAATAYRIYRKPSGARVSSLWRDLVYTLRVLRFSPMFTIVASVSLALGIGANTAIFQLLDAVRLRTLPVKSPQDIVELRIDDMTRFAGAVISYGFWQREFGGSASVIGRKIMFRDGAAEVIGVTPPAFFGLEVGRQFDFALPICAAAARGRDDRLDSGTLWWLTVMGRLKPGVSLAQADGRLQAMSRGIFETTLPAGYPPVSVKPYLAMKLHAIAAGGGLSRLSDQYSTPLGLLLAIAGLVLLIACANLTNLMLARASAREREIAVRLAIGASRADLIQQLMMEAMVLAFAGAVAALFLARELSRFLVAFLGTGADSVFLDVRPDWRVFAFASSLALLTCLLFGLAPALRATHAQPGDALKSGSRGVTAGREGFGLRRILVVAQVALSLVLLVGAVLFVRSLRNLMTLEPGFQENGILIANVSYGGLMPADRLPTLRGALVERIQAIPGVDAAAATASVPALGNAWINTMWMDGSDSGHGRDISRSMVGAGYFHTIGTPMLAGREFDERDTNSSRSVAIVSEAFTRVFSLGPNPVGKRFWIEKTPFAPQMVCEIIGVAKDSKYRDLRQDFMPVAFIPMSQFPQPLGSGNILIRSRLGLDALTPSVRRAISDVNPHIVFSFSTLKSQLAQSLVRERLMATLSGLFGVLALLLATVGLYGVISYTIARRTNEIGIRIALGASAAHVTGLILRETGMLLAAGLGAGLVMSFALSRAAATLLFGLTANDPLTYCGAGVALTIVALGASYIPARRAAGIDPAIALRDA